MHIGGIQKHSLIDFPGIISCVLFLSGCNFHCPYCHNPELVRKGLQPPSDITPRWFYDFLEKRKGLLEGVVITGGEPTLQQGLDLFCEHIKHLGYPVKLDTNGSRPDVLKKLIEKGLIDYMAMDLKTDPSRYWPALTDQQHSDNIGSSIHIIMNSGIEYEFRTTCVPPLIDEDVIDRLSSLIKGAKRYLLQRFRKTEILNPDFFKPQPYLYSDAELEHFKSIASPRVQRCMIR